jgi:hypothetical protein
MTVKYASFPNARSASPASQALTFAANAPANDGSGTNLLLLAVDNSRSYAIVRNNSPYQVVYGYEDRPDLDSEGEVLNPSDSVVITNKKAVYVRSLSSSQQSNIRVDEGLS